MESVIFLKAYWRNQYRTSIMTGLYLTPQQRERLNLGIVEVFRNCTAQLNVHPAVRKVEQKFPTSPVIVNCSANRVKIHSVSRK